MKKALVVFLILAVAGGLFAQTATFTGGVNSGLIITLKDDIGVAADGDYAKGAFTAAVDDGNWGAKFALAANTGTGFNLNDAFGWMKFAEGLFKLSAGQGFGNVVGGAFGRYGDGVGGGLGLKLDIDPPIDGLTFAVSFGYPDNTPGKIAGKIGNFFQQTAFGVDYSGAVHVGTSIKLFSEEDKYTSDGMDAKWVFGVGYDGVPGFSFVVSGGIEHLMKMADEGAETLAQQVQYKGITNLTLTLGVSELFVKSFELNGLTAGVGAEYNLTPVTLGAGANLGFDKDFKNSSWDANAWAKYTLGGSWLQGKFNLADSDGAGDVEVLPTLIITFGYSF